MLDERAGFGGGAGYCAAGTVPGMAVVSAATQADAAYAAGIDSAGGELQRDV